MAHRRAPGADAHRRRTRLPGRHCCWPALSGDRLHQHRRRHPQRPHPRRPHQHRAGRRHPHHPRVPGRCRRCRGHRHRPHQRHPPHRQRPHPLGRVINGQLFTVTGITDDGALAVRDQNTGDDMLIPASYAHTNIHLGYASTIHRAQGATVDTTHAVIDNTVDRAGLYVAMTRGKKKTAPTRCASTPSTRAPKTPTCTRPATRTPPHPHRS
ncbi:hypothetical protein ACFSSF_19295 [Dietzia aerolata]|uniref:hypothetical protein n=1 Tax=Dietzia aerolata TaxID=595984 RepID=UPI0036427DD0